MAKKTGGSSVRPAPKPTAKTTKVLNKLRQTSELLNKKPPAGWPANTVPNPRAFSPLPDGWCHAIKVTGKSPRGKGGSYRHCLVGPGGRLFWHKYDLEKHLGTRIEGAKKASRPRIVDPDVFKKYPQEWVLVRTKTASQKNTQAYIDERCDALGGKTVRYALVEYEFKRPSGKMHPYNISDLSYDVKHGRLRVQAPGKSTEAGAMQTSKKAGTGQKSKKVLRKGKLKASAGRKLVPAVKDKATARSSPSPAVADPPAASVVAAPAPPGTAAGGDAGGFVRVCEAASQSGAFRRIAVPPVAADSATSRFAQLEAAVCEKFSTARGPSGKEMGERRLVSLVRIKDQTEIADDEDVALLSEGDELKATFVSSTRT